MSKIENPKYFLEKKSNNLINLYNKLENQLKARHNIYYSPSLLKARNNIYYSLSLLKEHQTNCKTL